MPLRNLLVISLALAASFATWVFAERTRPGRRFNEVVTLIEQRHLEPIETAGLVDAAIEAAVARLDEHSEYLRGARREAIETALDQEFVGVGLELEADPASGQPVVVMPLPDGPAWQAGIVGRERIVAVDGVPTRGVPLSDVVRGLRGRRGTAVTLTLAIPAPPPPTLDPAAVQPHDVTRDVVLVRDLVRMETVLGDRRLPDGGWIWRLADAPEVALVRIVGFGEHTAAEFRAALTAITAGAGEPPPLRGLVLDLRDNPGGLLAAAVDVCDQLLDDGVIVTTRSRAEADAPAVRRATRGTLLPDVPVAVLVDGLTSSAAEIVAACLQDHGRAVVVGSRTFGKGTVQAIVPLAGGEQLLKLTTAEYLRPNGERLHRASRDGHDVPWGVTPDPGLEHTPTRAALDRLRAWRRARDTPSPPAEASPPRAIDEVLAKAVGHLLGSGAPD